MKSCFLIIMVLFFAACFHESKLQKAIEDSIQGVKTDPKDSIPDSIKCSSPIPFAEKDTIKKNEKKDVSSKDKNTEYDKKERDDFRLKLYYLAISILFLFSVVFVMFYSKIQEKHREDFANMAQITPEIFSSKFNVNNFDETKNFLEFMFKKVYSNCGIFYKYDDFSIILYCYITEGLYDKEKKNIHKDKKVLGRIAIEKEKSETVIPFLRYYNLYTSPLFTISNHEFQDPSTIASQPHSCELDLEKDRIRPAVGCFLDTKNQLRLEVNDINKVKDDIIQQYTFHDWENEREAYAIRNEIPKEEIENSKPISGHSTSSLIFAPLINKDKEVTGVLSFQTRKPNAFKRKILGIGTSKETDSIFVDSFKIITETVQAAIENNTQREEIQKRHEELNQIHNQLKETNYEMIIFHSIISHDIYNRIVLLRQLIKQIIKLKSDNKNYEVILNLTEPLIEGTEIMFDNLREEAAENLKIRQFDHIKLSCKKKTFNLFEIQKRIEQYIPTDGNMELNFDFSEVNSIYADEVMLETIVRNLITNAIKFSKEDGSKNTIEVYSKLFEDHIAIFVKDTGKGMSNEEILGLCSVLSKKNKLGLFISKQLIETQGGKLTIESMEGSGSTFCISLPKKNECKKLDYDGSKN